MEELGDKIYRDCMDLLMNTRFITAYISHMAIYIDDIAGNVCDLNNELDEEQLDEILYHYEDFIVPNLDSLNRNFQYYQLNILELENNINQLLSKYSDRGNN